LALFSEGSIIGMIIKLSPRTHLVLSGDFNESITHVIT
jgi:hypothetical protein